MKETAGVDDIVCIKQQHRIDAELAGLGRNAVDDAAIE